METIFKQYGGAIIVTIVAGILFTLIVSFANPDGSKGIFGALGLVAETTNDVEERTATASKTAMEEVVTRKEPVISATGMVCLAGQTYSLADVTNATDCDGNAATVLCSKITDPAADDVTADTYSNENLVFSRQGTYRLYITAIDDVGASVSRWIVVNVER